MGKIRHPNVARLHRFDKTEDGRPYMVFELVTGSTLQQIIEEHREVKPETGLDWMFQAASALMEAWKHHIIHRDLKPGNLMIDLTGRLKLLDFGLAKALHEDLSITVDKAPVGTPRYISPEIGMGQSADFRADMYSLGATFYHLFVGQAPFEADTAVAMMMKHANAPLPPPHSIDPSLPDDICTILTRLLAKDPNDRYESYQDLMSDLKESRLALIVRNNPGAIQREPVESDLSPSMDPDFAVASQTSLEQSMKAEGTAAASRAERAANLELDTLPKSAGSKIFLTVLLVFVVSVGALLVVQFNGLRSSAGSGGNWLNRALSSLELPQGTYTRKEARALEDEMQRKMEIIMSAILEYEAATGQELGSLGEMLRERRLNRAEVDDVWGARIEFRGLPKKLYSSGVDGVFGTADDFILNRSLALISGEIPTMANRTAKNLGDEADFREIGAPNVQRGLDSLNVPTDAHPLREGERIRAALVAKMEYLMTAIVDHELRTGQRLIELDDLVRSGTVGRDDLIDIWNAGFQYDGVDKLLTSAGPDAEFDSYDDFVLHSSMRLVKGLDAGELAGVGGGGLSSTAQIAIVALGVLLAIVAWLFVGRVREHT